MTFGSILTDFLASLNVITVGFAIIFATIAIFQKRSNGKKKDLEFYVNRSFAGSALPTGIALLCCAFKPDLLNKLDGASLNVAVAGITLLFISIKSIFISSE
jgi:hypothetical protein